MAPETLAASSAPLGCPASAVYGAESPSAYTTLVHHHHHPFTFPKVIRVVRESVRLLTSPFVTVPRSPIPELAVPPESAVPNRENESESKKVREG